MKRLFLIITVLTCTSFMVSAQATLNDAGTKFNQGNESLKNKDYANAIAAYNDALTICNSLGDEGTELAGKIQGLIPSTYYNYGADLIKTKQLDEAIKQLQKGMTEAQKYNNPTIEKKASSLIGNIYLAKAGAAYGQKNYDETLGNCQEALKFNSKSAKAYLFEALVYSNKDDENNLLNTANQAIQYATVVNDEKTISSAKSTAFTYFTNKAQNLFSKDNYTEAIKLFDKAIIFDSLNQTVLYLKTSSLNKLEKYDDAIKCGQLGLTAPNDNNEQFLGINLELARAYEAKGDTEKACKHYTIAAKSANFKAEAEAKMKDVLKCK